MEDAQILDRRLTKREVDFLLKRSSRLQRQETQAVVESQTPELGDLTLSDLEEIADEVGVDPYYLQLAATELDASGVPLDLERVLGGPFSIRVERSLPRELQEAEMEEMVSEIEAAAATSGTATLRSRSLLWRSKGPLGSDPLLPLHVTVRSRQGRTRIGIEERYHALTAVLYGGLVGGIGVGVGVGGGVGVGIGALHSPAFALLFPAAFLAGSCFVARQSFALVTQQRRRAVFDLLERLSEKVTDEDESSDAD